MMVKINKITIENFRGIKLPIEIDLKKGGNNTSCLIYGRNGTGKSSIVDAWEWFLNFDIESLRQEGISARDYPHKLSGGNKSYIEVIFDHPTIKSAKAAFSSARITTPTTTGEYNDFKKYSVYPNHLRYSDLQKFVYLSKTEKYKYIAKFFGLEKFVKKQSDIQACITRLTGKRDNIRQNLNSNKLKIQTLISKPNIDEQAVVDFINAIAIKHQITVITQFNEAYKVKKSLDTVVSASPIAKALTEWTSFQINANSFYPISTLKSDAEALESVFKDLKKDEANITQLILSDVYRASIAVLPQLPDKAVCPICDTPFDGDLLDHITQKHTLLQGLNAKKSDFEKKKDNLRRMLEKVLQKVTNIQSEHSSTVRTELADFFDRIKNINDSIPDIIELLKKDFHDIPDIFLSTNTVIEDIDFIAGSETSTKTTVAQKIALLNADPQTKDLAVDLTALVELNASYTDFLKNSSKSEYLEDISSNLSLLLEKLTSFIQLEIQNTFLQIQTDLTECFSFLEGTNPFIKNPEIKLVTGRDKAVELEIEFVSEKTSPAHKFMSESQVNSFGLAIFLSAVKHFNKDFKFILLDDVVNSFDAYKRPKVVQLLNQKFSDFQILLLTHDQVFFDTAQKAFPAWQRYKFTGWDYNTGPQIKLSKSQTEYIQSLIDDDQPIEAGQSLGRYMEWALGSINETMATPIRFKSEHIYTLAELYDPLVARFKSKLKQQGRTTHKVNLGFTQFEQGTIFRNYCVHWKDEATPFTTPEIDAVFKQWMLIEEMLYCNNCKTFVHFENGSPEYVRCNCGEVNLNDQIFWV